MNNFFNRAIRRMKSTAANFHKDCNFSLNYALLRVVDEVGGRLRLRRLSQSARQAKDQWILRYLSKQLEPVISKFEDDSTLGEYIPNAPIWICWWTGEETAPALVRQCIHSSYKNAGNHPVHLITKENYQQYLEIPEFMLQKVNSGQMGFAHLADYIRVKLLATRGGLWLDATIFCSQEIPSMCFDLPLFTCKGPVQKCGYVSDYRWVTFCLGGWKGNVFYRFLVEAFEQYWRNNSSAIDYLFFDHIILIAYTRILAIRDLLDNLPDNNIHRDDLQAAMNAALPASDFDSVINADTVLYKLSWRENYQTQTSTRLPSIYTRFLEYETL